MSTPNNNEPRNSSRRQNNATTDDDTNLDSDQPHQTANATSNAPATSSPPSLSSSLSTLSSRSSPTTPTQHLSPGSSTITSGISNPAHYPSRINLASRVPHLPRTRHPSPESPSQALLDRWARVFGPGHRLGSQEEHDAMMAAERRRQESGVVGDSAAAGSARPGTATPAEGRGVIIERFDTPDPRAPGIPSTGMATTLFVRAADDDGSRTGGALRGTGMGRLIDGADEEEDDNDEVNDLLWSQTLRRAEERGHERSLGALKRKRAEEDEEGSGVNGDGAGVYEDVESEGEGMDLLNRDEDGAGAEEAQKNGGDEGSEDGRELKKAKLG